MDKIAFYSVFGGSPYINSFINKDISLEENIKRFFLDEHSLVFNYADSLFISDAVNSLQDKKIISFIGNGKNSLIVSLGVDNFFDGYIKDSLITFIPHRFEEVVRSYYSLLSIKGHFPGVRNIGTYY